MPLKISLPFLATRSAQMMINHGNACVEATIFNRADLDKDSWAVVWQNIEAASLALGPKNVTFHFPVNNCDYTTDAFVRQRLIEALQRASELGLHGIVVHSNRIRPLDAWETVDLEEDRNQVIEALHDVRSTLTSSTWLALENMPVMDNYGIEIDPLFCYPEDFSKLQGSNIGIVWDLCHFTNTIATIDQVRNGKQNPKYYPNIKFCTAESFSSLEHQICHWHFSSFKGIPNPDTGEECKEGVLPWESSISEEVYVKLLTQICEIAKPNQHMVLEIAENNYENRTQAPLMMQWLKEKGPTNVYN